MMQLTTFRCAQVDRKTLNTITGQVMQLTARDLMSLWRLYVKVRFQLRFLRTRTLQGFTKECSALHRASNFLFIVLQEADRGDKKNELEIIINKTSQVLI